jgi:hypothetical protein
MKLPVSVTIYSIIYCARENCTPAICKEVPVRSTQLNAQINTNSVIIVFMPDTRGNKLCHFFTQLKNIELYKGRGK